ncbi:Conserved hypothetical protein [Criblamydia sequanensis CRIB-18]|uniref:Peptidase M48 domain-containing protein n=1 Tax=Candidatus Criblamydia sequanensis CRIB-18 TaxID=1437425 RepID=A0A090CZA6_9BACT|nr:Conserved hypothetical protein [Criblamydia sequanensis CRIB-18]
MLFSRFIFLIYVLFLIAIAPSKLDGSFFFGIKPSFFLGLLSFFLSYSLIYALSLKFNMSLKKGFVFVSELLLLACFLINLFLLGSQRIFFTNFSLFPAVVLFSTFFIFLYFLGLFFIHYLDFRLKSGSQENNEALDKKAYAHGLHQILLFLPLILPFFFLLFFFHLLSFLLEDDLTDSKALLALLAILPIFIICFPWFVQKAWCAYSLESYGEPSLVEHLNQICERASFKHGGLKVWTALDRAPTAAIIGTYHKFRYILFTKKLLNSLSDNALGAVLAHEIGHCKKGHLFFIPFVFSGMFLLGFLFSLFIHPSLYNYFLQFFNPLLGSLAESASDLAIVLIYLLLFALYFRFIFGFYIRLYEREADLYGQSISVSPRHLINALNTIGILGGNIHSKPSWHHYSIEIRNQILEQSIVDPNLGFNHSKKVKKWNLVYVFSFFLLLTLGFAGIKLTNFL